MGSVRFLRVQNTWKYSRCFLSSVATRGKQDGVIRNKNENNTQSNAELCNDKLNGQSINLQFSNSLRSDHLWFDIVSLDAMGRRELQKLCKKLGIRAISKTTKLIEDLKEFHALHLAPKSSSLHFPFIPAILSYRYNEHLSSNAVDKNVGMFAPLQTSFSRSTKIGNLCQTTRSQSTSFRAVSDPADSFAFGADVNGLSFYGCNNKTQPGRQKVPSVTTVLNSSKPLALIMKWREKKIKELGEEGFKKYQSDFRKQGIAFHSYIKSFLSGESTEPSNSRGCVESVSGVLKDIDSVIAAEKQVSHLTLGYSGYFDTLALYQGVPCILEWKTSQNPKPTMHDCYEYPLQAVAYAGAVNSSPYLSVPVTNCVIVIAYPDGSPAHVHRMDLSSCDYYWQQWLVKLFNYKKKLTN